MREGGTSFAYRDMNRRMSEKVGGALINRSWLLAKDSSAVTPLMTGECCHSAGDKFSKQDGNQQTLQSRGGLQVDCLA